MRMAGAAERHCPRRAGHSHRRQDVRQTKRYNATKNKFGYVDDVVGVALQLHAAAFAEPDHGGQCSYQPAWREGDSAYKQYLAFVFIMLVAECL